MGLVVYLFPKIIKSFFVIIISIFLIGAIEYFLFLISPGMSEQIYDYTGSGSKYISYLRWFMNVVTSLDFGRKFLDGGPILDSLKSSVGLTLKLTGGAIFFMFIFSLTAAILNVHRSGKWYSSVWNGLLNMLSGFHIIILSVIVFYSIGPGEINTVGIFPMLILALGNGSIGDASSHLTATFQRVFEADYIKAARARGGSIWKNALNEILISVLALLNSRFPYLIGGAFIIEIFFNIQGLGLKIIKGIENKEAFLLISITLVVSLLVLVLNQLVSMAHVFLDPRLRRDSK